MGDPDGGGHAPGVVQVVDRAAGAEALAVALVVELHRDAHHVVARLGQQRRGHRRVHAARHRDNDAHVSDRSPEIATASLWGAGRAYCPAPPLPHTGNLSSLLPFRRHAQLGLDSTVNHRGMHLPGSQRRIVGTRHAERSCGDSSGRFDFVDLDVGVLQRESPAVCPPRAPLPTVSEPPSLYRRARRRNPVWRLTCKWKP